MPMVECNTKSRPISFFMQDSEEVHEMEAMMATLVKEAYPEYGNVEQVRYCCRILYNALLCTN